MKKYSIRHLPFDAKEGVPQTRRVCRNVWYGDRLGHKSQTERLGSVTYWFWFHSRGPSPASWYEAFAWLNTFSDLLNTFSHLLSVFCRSSELLPPSLPTHSNWAAVKTLVQVDKAMVVSARNSWGSAHQQQQLHHAALVQGGHGSEPMHALAVGVKDVMMACRESCRRWVACCLLTYDYSTGLHPKSEANYHSI